MRTVIFLSAPSLSLGLLTLRTSQTFPPSQYGTVHRCPDFFESFFARFLVTAVILLSRKRVGVLLNRMFHIRLMLLFVITTGCPPTNFPLALSPQEKRTSVRVIVLPPMYQQLYLLILPVFERIGPVLTSTRHSFPSCSLYYRLHGIPTPYEVQHRTGAPLLFPPPCKDFLSTVFCR